MKSILTFVSLLIVLNAYAQNPDFYKINMCIDAMARIKYRTTSIEDFRAIISHSQLDTLRQSGFKNTIFYRLKIYRRPQLESILYTYTADSFNKRLYLDHPELVTKNKIDSVLSRAYNICSTTPNSTLVSLIKTKGIDIKGDTIYYAVRLDRDMLWCLRINSRALALEETFLKAVLQGDILDNVAASHLDATYSSDAAGKKMLNRELCSMLYVEDLGGDFMCKF